MNRVLPAFILLGVLVTPIVVSADDAANEAIARRYYAEFNARDFEALSEFVSVDFVDHTGNGDGVGALQRRMEALVAEVPDARISIQLILVSGDHVTVIANIAGTSGGMMPADQRPVDYAAIDVWLIRDGMLSEIWRSD